MLKKLSLTMAALAFLAGVGTAAGDDRMSLAAGYRFVNWTVMDYQTEYGEAAYKVADCFTPLATAGSASIDWGGDFRANAFVWGVGARGRLASVRDFGLYYDVSRGQLHAEDGVKQLDYAKWTSNLTVGKTMHGGWVMQSVTPIAGYKLSVVECDFDYTVPLDRDSPAPARC